MRGRRLPEAVRRIVAARDEIVIRWAAHKDAERLSELAQLAGRPELSGPVLLAEADGALVAAVSSANGLAVADPFVASSDVVALLRFRADQLDAAA